jgi:2-keto-3-deoxy-L-rhamnonate aldolase RhmA
MTRRIEADTFVVAMVESAGGVAEAGAIAAVPGIDAVIIGANDLAADMGHLGAVDHPEVLAAFAAVAAATLAQGKIFGVIGVGAALLSSHALDLGARLIVATNDINLLIDQGTAVAQTLRERTGQAAPAAG